MNLAQAVVSYIKKVIMALGEFMLFAAHTFRCLSKFWLRRHLFLRHCEDIGVSSAGIITVSGTFLGSVLGYQLYVSFHLFGMESLLGGSVGVGLFRELAPVMAAIMVTGRAGAAMAAELASMRVSEQLDALEVMAIDPIEYLVMPRALAGLLMMPILAVFFGSIGSMAAAGIACGVMGLDSAVFWSQFTQMTDVIELVHCVTKGAAFGLFLALIACYSGFNAFGGARAVGFATRSSVVVTCLSILLIDYILTSLLPFGHGNFVVS